METTWKSARNKRVTVFYNAATKGISILTIYAFDREKFEQQNALYPLKLDRKLGATYLCSRAIALMGNTFDSITTATQIMRENKTAEQANKALRLINETFITLVYKTAEGKDGQ